MKITCRFNYLSPFGNLVATMGEDGCERLEFAFPAEESGPLTSGAEMIKIWLDDYFAGKKPSIANLPLAIKGTDFQKKVWEQLLSIPYGETSVYSEISIALTGNGNSSRAAGQAIGANPLAIIVPCHRVLAKNGLGGYAWGTEIKKNLLAHERARKNFLA